MKEIPLTQGYVPTPEQEACVLAAKSTSSNLIIHALAGAAKTSTLILIAKALPSIPILSLAFNRRIAKEMEDRLPGNCQAMTLNSLGHRAWASGIGKRLIIDTGKTYKIVKDLVDTSPDKSELYENFSTLLLAVDAGKTCGWVPDGTYKSLSPKRLMDDGEFFNWLDEEPTEAEWDLIRTASKTSLAEAFQGRCDYNDQILLPTCFPLGVFPSYPLVLVDEAQDLSALNHAMLRKLVRKRVIAVGDECQSIYGFRGAHEDSMALLADTFAMEKLTLSVSFRCPISVVEAARWRAPHMQYPEWAQPGQVTILTEWGVEALPREATILCRNNAPLFSMAIKLLKAGRYPELVGNDIGKSLIKIMEKLGDATLSSEGAREELAKWAITKEKKARDKSKVADMVACMTVFLDQGKTLGDAIAYAKHLLAQSGPVKLLTIHKAKGLEWDHVFLLNRELIKTEYDMQEKNLLYVAQTRAKATLTYVNLEDFNA